MIIRQGSKGTHISGDRSGARARVYAQVVDVFGRLRWSCGWERARLHAGVGGPERGRGGYEGVEEDVLAGEHTGDRVCRRGGEEGEDGQAEDARVRLSFAAV